MRKYVYLHELDSVRKTDWEIIRGQQALYDEIVGNGNIVVLTYNQLVDSRGFFSLWDNPEYQGSLVELFQNGAIRISLDAAAVGDELMAVYTDIFGNDLTERFTL